MYTFYISNTDYLNFYWPTSLPRFEGANCAHWKASKLKVKVDLERWFSLCDCDIQYNHKLNLFNIETRYCVSNSN